MNNNQNSIDIDLVYLWVDGNDPDWIARHNAFTGNTQATTAVDCKGRYFNNNELMYSLRSVDMYAPWIRRIFIVTDRQVPQWLDTSNPKIRIVDHSEILPDEAIPTFNSVVIEHNLHRIPGLSEHFLYANDDTFINRPVSPADFFAPDGQPLIRLNQRPFRKLYLLYRKTVMKKPLTNYNLTIHRAASLVESKLGKYIGGKPHHNIDAYCKSEYSHIAEVFSDEIKPTLANHIRSDNDIQRSIYTFATLAEHKGHRQNVTRKTSFHVHIDNPTHLEKLAKKNPMLFCLNDSQLATDNDRIKAKEFLLRRFPEKSQFEK